jgi:hypothetical protein
MKNNFSKKIAKEIAIRQLEWTLDCMYGNGESDYHLLTDTTKFEDNFVEDLESRNITSTQKRIEIINSYYTKYVEVITTKIENYLKMLKK